MRDDILRLAGNPAALPLDDVLHLLRTAPGADVELQRVLPREVWQTVSALAPDAAPPALADAAPTPVPTDVKPCRSESFTTFCLWGQRGAGKTTVVNSLLSTLTDVELCPDSDTPRHRQILRLLDPIQEAANVCWMPAEQTDRRLTTTHVVVKQKRWGLTWRRPMTFVETDCNSDGSYTVVQRFVTPRSIHILCLDCTADIDAQTQAFMRLLDDLSRGAFLTRESAVYIVVTKTDTMLRVPREKRGEVARTLITAGQRPLWLRLTSLCRQSHTVCASPIAFSVGETWFDRLFCPDHAGVAELRDKILLPHSRVLLGWGLPIAPSPLGRFFPC